MAKDKTRDAIEKQKHLSSVECAGTPALDEIVNLRGRGDAGRGKSTRAINSVSNRWATPDR